VRPVVNALRILRYLSASRNAVRSLQLARDLSINPSTCFNILRTLVAENVLLFDPTSKTYMLSEELLSITDASAAEKRQLSLAQPILHQLAQTHRVTATLWRRIRPERIVLVGIEHSPTEMRIDISPRQRLPSLIGATGRLVAATSNMSKAETERAFHSLRWARPLAFETYWKQVKLAAERGWAVDESYFGHGIVSIAAPVWDLSGSFSLSISALAFVGQHKSQEIDRIGEEVALMARQLSDAIYR
jgi:DNA-binding IclR family transcriptional regulator